MSAALNRKVSLRAGLRAYLNSTIKEVEDYLKTDEIEKAKLITYQKRLLNVVEQIKVANEDVLKSLDPENIENDVVESLQCMEPVSELETMLELKLSEFTVNNDRSASPPLTNRSDRSSVSVSNRHVTLPKLEIPVFEGNPLLWQGFYDQFRVAIDENECLQDIDKFNYLKRFLGGEALKSVSGLTLSTENYKEALDLLKERYGNEQVLVSAHMEALLKIQKIRNCSDIKGLRSLYNEIENCIRNLRSLKLETRSYGALLIPMLKDKLPEELLISISRKFGGNLWDLDNLLTYFGEELRVYENCVSLSQLKVSADSKENRNSARYTTSGMLVHEEKEKIPCIYCKRLDHAPYQCRIVTNLKTRKDIVVKEKRCFICLSSGHIAKNCKQNYSCRRCRGRHNISICTFDSKNDKSTTYDRHRYEHPKETDKSTNATHVQSQNTILLQTGKGFVSGADEDCFSQARILFDTGSQRSYITDDLRNKLKLRTIRSERTTIKTFGNENATVKRLDVVEFKVKSKFNEKFLICEALCVPVVCSPIRGQNVNFAKRFGHIKSLELADSSDGRFGSSIDILIGADFYHRFFTGRYRKGNEGPTACESILGWVLSGPNGVSLSGQFSCNVAETHVLRCLVECQQEDSLRQKLAQFWEVDSLGVRTDEADSNGVFSDFEKEIYHDGNRYVTKLPFKPRHETLPDNFSVCEHRLACTKKKLISQGILGQYDKIFEEYQSEGIIERVPDNDIAKGEGLVHYLPHRAVVRQDKKTTKIRAVFDASCGINGPSLNECLYSGPNLLGKIFDILIRFRLNKVAITADIKQAFLNIGIHPDHRDYLRFLWHDFDGGHDVVVYRFLRVVFGVTSSPFLLNGTIRQHLRKYEHEKGFVKRFLEDLYVDDTASGCNSVEEGITFCKKAMTLMSEAGFSLRKWSSNNTELQKLFDKMNIESEEQRIVDDFTFLESQMNGNKFSSDKVLGVEWNKKNDQIVFNFGSFLDKCYTMTLTKRNILSISASIYDPMGLISPITAWMKTVFQLLCKENLDWDEEVPNHIRDSWVRFVKVVEEVKEIKVDRFVLSTERLKGVELHGFCDSSSEVYSAVVYLRVETDNRIQVHLLSSKTKVAPMKKLTIPRLELLGCHLLSKLLSEVQTAILDRVIVDRVVCWCDSKVALNWIKGKERSWKVWIENRVVKIRDVVDRENWFYVPSAFNPADIPTRKLNGFKDIMDGFWFEGPSFLLNTESLSKFLCAGSVLDNCSRDVMTEHVNFAENDSTQNTHGNIDDILDTNISEIVDFQRFNSLCKLVNTVGYMMRFINNLKKRIRKDIELVITEAELSHNERMDAEKIIIKDEQCKIRNQSNYLKVKSSLNLFDDQDGLMRLRGRFGNAELQHAEMYPILLRRSHFANLVVQDSHERMFHHGIETTLANVRRKFWIIRGRQLVKSLLRRCVICKRFQGRTLIPPTSPDLPDFRLNLMNAFQATGLDYAGPLFVKDYNCKDGQKVYILLFTCATSRAVHLELCADMTNNSFIQGFKRFISRRGVPAIIVHDNFKTFRSKEVQRFLACIGVNQRFILPASPWWGGFYERLVKTVKMSLKKTLGRSFISFEDLRTMLCEVESVINSRPLHYVSDDDLLNSLTPNHLIYGRDISKRCHSSKYKLPEYNLNDAKRKVRYIERLLKSVWKQFSNNYLHELRQNNLYRKQKTNDNQSLSLGEVVLIHGGLLPRAEWKMARIEKLIVGADGKTRGAMVSTTSKAGKRTTVHRPLQKLIPLELNQTFETNLPTQHISENDTADERHENNRPTRKAAKEGQYLRRLKEGHY